MNTVQQNWRCPQCRENRPDHLVWVDDHYVRCVSCDCHYQLGQASNDFQPTSVRVFIPTCPHCKKQVSHDDKVCKHCNIQFAWATVRVPIHSKDSSTKLYNIHAN